MPAGTAQSSVADAVRRMEADLGRRRFIALVEIGVEKHLTVAELAEGLPAEESKLLARVLGSITAAELRAWLDTKTGAAHLGAVLGGESASAKRPRNGARKKRAKNRTKQPGLPGVPKGRISADSLAFDRQVILLISQADATEGAKAGEIKGQLKCSRGKLRLSLGRAKKNQWIRQTGELNGSRYFVTGSGLEFAEAKPKSEEN